MSILNSPVNYLNNKNKQRQDGFIWSSHKNFVFFSNSIRRDTCMHSCFHFSAHCSHLSATVNNSHIIEKYLCLRNKSQAFTWVLSLITATANSNSILLSIDVSLVCNWQRLLSSGILRSCICDDIVCLPWNFYEPRLSLYNYFKDHMLV